MLRAVWDKHLRTSRQSGESDSLSPSKGSQQRQRINSQESGAASGGKNAFGPNDHQFNMYTTGGLL